MLPDIAIAVGIAVAQLVLGFYGIYIAANGKQRKQAIIVFAVVGGIGLLLTSATVIRSTIAQTEIQGALTGGDTRPYIKPGPVAFLSNGQATVTCSLELIGNYPLHDVSYNVISSQGMHEFKPGNVYPNMVGRTVEYPTFTFPDDSSKQPFYQITIATSNGNYYQQIRFAKVNGKWIHALKLNEGSSLSQSSLYRDIEDGYPTGADGQVDWTKP
jgi:hypothetical protein